MMTLDFVLNTAGLTACTVVANEKISYSTAFMFSLTKEVISAKLGGDGDPAAVAAGILGGMVVTKVMDPEHRVDFPTAMKAVGYLGMSQIFWAILGVGVAMAAGNELR